MAHSTLSGSFIVDSLFNGASIVCGCSVFFALFCYVAKYLVFFLV